MKFVGYVVTVDFSGPMGTRRTLLDIFALQESYRRIGFGAAVLREIASWLMKKELASFWPGAAQA